MLKFRWTSERLECRRNNIKTQINQTSILWFLNISDGCRASPSRRRVRMKRNEYLMYGHSAASKALHVTSGFAIETEVTAVG